MLKKQTVTIGFLTQICNLNIFFFSNVLGVQTHCKDDLCMYISKYNKIMRYKKELNQNKHTLD